MSQPITDVKSQVINLSYNKKLFLTTDNIITNTSASDTTELFTVDKHENQYVLRLADTSNNWFYIKDTYHRDSAVTS